MRKWFRFRRSNPSASEPRSAYLDHDIPKMSVRMKEKPDGSLELRGVSTRFVTHSGDPYEYTITIAPEHLAAVRAAVGAGVGQDGFEAIRAHSREILRQGEMTWLNSCNIPYQFDAWAPWEEDEGF
jgi:hypothetical protein